MSRTMNGLLVLALGCAIVFGASSTLARRPPGPVCECAPIDHPVICSNGTTYLNPCVASCFGGKDCVPTEGGGELP